MAGVPQSPTGFGDRHQWVRTAACGEQRLRGWSTIVLTLDRRLYDGDVAPPGPSLYRLYDGSVGAPYTLCCSHGFVCGEGGRRGQRWGLRGRCVDSCTTSLGASPPLTPSLYRLCGDVGTHYSLCCSHDFVCAGGEGEGSRGWVGRRRLRQEAVVQGAVVVRGGGEQRLGRVAAADAGGLWCRGLWCEIGCRVDI